MILLIIIPFLTGCVAWFVSGMRSEWSRWVSLLGLGLDGALVIALYAQAGTIDYSVRGPWLAQITMPWIPQLGISFQLAMDGVSLLLIGLSVFLGMASVLVSWNEIQDAVGFFHFNLLIVISGIIGVFLAVDLILFYFFWEVMLVPMYFLISVWGHENRTYAALKFFIFTQVGSLLMLLSILGLYFMHGRSTGIYTFDFFQLQHVSLSLEVSVLLALGFIAAFAVKLPVIVLHTWLPDAHTEAPTAGSVILAGLLLKTGAFGFIRFVLPIFPAASAHLAPAAMILGIAGIIYGAVMAFAQTDLKRLVAYSSVSHLGFVLVGIFAFNELALQGATIQMIAHGISTGALFMVVGMLQERIHTRDMDRMGGLWSTVPTMGAVALVFGLASLGLPGTINFDGEFLILVGAYKTSPVVAAFSATGLVFSAVYSLYAIYRVFFGEKRVDWTIADLSTREFGALAAMIAAVFFLGFYPKPVIKAAAPAIKAVETRMLLAREGLNSIPSKLVADK